MVALDLMYINARTPKKVKPNLHHMMVDTPAGKKRMVVCTRCMRTMRKRSGA